MLAWAEMRRDWREVRRERGKSGGRVAVVRRGLGGLFLEAGAMVLAKSIDGHVDVR